MEKDSQRLYKHGDLSPDIFNSIIDRDTFWRNLENALERVQEGDRQDMSQILENISGLSQYCRPKEKLVTAIGCFYEQDEQGCLHEVGLGAIKRAFFYGLELKDVVNPKDEEQEQLFVLSFGIPNPREPQAEIPIYLPLRGHESIIALEIP